MGGRTTLVLREQRNCEERKGREYSQRKSRKKEDTGDSSEKGGWIAFFLNGGVEEDLEKSCKS